MNASTPTSTSSTGPIEADDNFDIPRPLKLVPSLPSPAARRSFQARLQKRGVSAESAAAVARAVVNPELAKDLLDNATAYRVPGAELLVIRVEVYTTRVIADATNPRILNNIPFPAAIRPGSDQRARSRPAAATAVPGSRRLRGVGRQHGPAGLAT